MKTRKQFADNFYYFFSARTRALLFRSSTAPSERARKRRSDTATLPEKGSPGAAGFDIYSSQAAVVKPGKVALVKTGLSLQLPLGCYARVAPRSGLALKLGIDVLAGVIDADYRGEVGVVLINHGECDYVIKPAQRIAQLILEKCYTDARLQVVSVLETSKRDGGGFGSTGSD